MTTLYDFPPFPGFRPEALDFLRALKQHNRRDWFRPRKAIYEDEVRWPMQCLVADVGRELIRRGLPLRGDPEQGLFRIYRDTRFSKDKRPYKTHIGAVLSRTGSRRDLASCTFMWSPATRFWGPASGSPRRPSCGAGAESCCRRPRRFWTSSGNFRRTA
nr:TIGR02453 family protein [Rhodothermus marinus]